MDKNIFVLVVFGILFGIAISCDTMEDTYKEFVSSGETLYIGKADSIKVKGGRNRLELTWLLLSDPKVASYKVFWNNRADSIEDNLVKTKNVDTVRIMFDPIKQGIHQFDIYLYDKEGNSSVRSSKIGEVYGSDYENSLLNRTYLSAIRQDGNIIIQWMPAEPEVTMVEVEYKNNMDKLVKKEIPGKVNVDTLFNFPINGSFSYRTVFLPDSLAIDAFYAPTETFNFVN